MMLKRVKPLLTVGLLAGAVSLILGYASFLEPAVTPGQLPGRTVGGVAIVALVALAVTVPSYVDGLVWKRAGRAVGLTASGGPEFASGPPEKATRRRSRALPRAARSERGCTARVPEVKI